MCVYVSRLGCSISIYSIFFPVLVEPPTIFHEPYTSLHKFHCVSQQFQLPSSPSITTVPSTNFAANAPLVAHSSHTPKPLMRSSGITSARSPQVTIEPSCRNAAKALGTSGASGADVFFSNDLPCWILGCQAYVCCLEHIRTAWILTLLHC